MPTTRAAPVPADAEGLADTRVRFLTADRTESGSTQKARPAILASWRRSRDLKVAADKIDLHYLRDPDVESPLARSAEPVLRSLREQLDGQPVSIILTDPTGLVLSRRTANTDLERHLDSVLLAPGFSYAEEFVGTNGIGTALEAGTATHVFGHEHYAENLENLACAGVPIHDPSSGRTVGAVDLTCWRHDADSLLLTLAKSTAERIEQALRSDAGQHELELFQAYRRTCKQMSGIVFALTSDAVLINDYARAVLDPADQAALLAHATSAAEGVPTGRHWTVGVLLPSGTAAKMHLNQVRAGADAAGVVVHVKLGDMGAQLTGVRDLTPQMQLPGLVGHAPLWLRACNEVETGFRAGDWLALSGEPGVGKLALLRAVQLRRPPGGRLAVLDAADAARDPRWLAMVKVCLQEDADRIIVAHVDQLSAAQLRGLSAVLHNARRAERERPLWAAATYSRAGGSAEFAQLLRLFPRTIDVPPLRLHLEDLDELVSFFLGKLGHGVHISCSPEAMRLLMRSSWPGNVEQVHQLLREVVQHRRSRVIRPSDLPPEAQTISRRRLSPLESMERDAIVKGLSDAQGNKLQAARALGMSRATIYRKIHEYGIVALPTPTDS